MIILEGPDGSGKTTLGKKLVEGRIVRQVLDSPSRTRGKVPLLDQTLRYLRLYGKNHSLAIDRFIFSEMVYGPIVRGKCQFPTSFALNLQMEVMLMGCPIIFCLPPSVEKLNLTAEKQMPGVDLHIEKIFNKYVEIYNRIATMYANCYRYDFTESDAYSNLIDKLREYGQR